MVVLSDQDHITEPRKNRLMATNFSDFGNLANGGRPLELLSIAVINMPAPWRGSFMTAGNIGLPLWIETNGRVSSLVEVPVPEEHGSPCRVFAVEIDLPPVCKCWECQDLLRTYRLWGRVNSTSGSAAFEATMEGFSVAANVRRLIKRGKNGNEFVARVYTSIGSLENPVKRVFIWMASPCIGIYVCFEEPSRLSIFEAGLSDAMGRHRAYKNLAEGFKGTLSTIHRLHHASQKTQASAHLYRSDSKVSDVDGQPYTTLLYSNGPGYTQPRNILREASKDSIQTSGVPRAWATHGGEDVPVFAIGPLANVLFSGSIDQSYIPHAISYASCLGHHASRCSRDSTSSNDTMSVPISCPSAEPNSAAISSDVMNDQARNPPTKSGASLEPAGSRSLTSVLLPLILAILPCPLEGTS
ncbi:Alkaline phosphatase, tissue-nonspecific isozyme [Eufriesea mexicana]|nr:Alkaline phosphatase, tissue-nonspecific isozyme [Eufriesea mexicana]